MYRFDTDAKNEKWDALIASEDHFFEYSLSINGATPNNGVREDGLISMTSEFKMFGEEQPTVGGCLASELTVEMFAPDFTIPRMAKVRPYVRVVNSDGTDYSEWLPQGVYWIDTRTTTKNDDGLDILSFHAYDSMLKAEGDYPNTTHNWPYLDINVVKEIAYGMGLQSSISSTAGIDPRTIALMNKEYTLGAPVGQSMREVLSNIAKAYAGNWVMNYDGQLLLVAMNGIPPETNYLITHGYDAIIFGTDDGGEDVYILV